MKRLALGALGAGLLLTVAVTQGEAQAVRVGVGIHVPRVGIRFEYGPQRVYPVRRIFRYDSRRHALNYSYMSRFERELYREWLEFEYSRWLRQNRRARFRNQRAWERSFLRDQRRAEKAFRKWERDRERELARLRDRRDDRRRDRIRDRERDRNRNRPRTYQNGRNRGRTRGRG